MNAHTIAHIFTNMHGPAHAQTMQTGNLDALKVASSAMFVFAKTNHH